jgi:hypothetical protein
VAFSATLPPPQATNTNAHNSATNRQILALATG